MKPFFFFSLLPGLWIVNLAAARDRKDIALYRKVYEGINAAGTVQLKPAEVTPRAGALKCDLARRENPTPP